MAACVAPPPTWLTATRFHVGRLEITVSCRVPFVANVGIEIAERLARLRRSPKNRFANEPTLATPTPALPPGIDRGFPLVLALRAPPPDLLATSRDHVGGCAFPIQDWVPLRSEHRHEVGQRLLGRRLCPKRRSASDATLPTPSARRPLKDLRFPLALALRTPPPDLRVAAGEHVIRSQVAVKGWVPLRGKFRHSLGKRLPRRRLSNHDRDSAPSDRHSAAEIVQDL
jgi:hypothetical protein